MKLSAFLYYQNCPRTRRLYTTVTSNVNASSNNARSSMSNNMSKVNDKLLMLNNTSENNDNVSMYNNVKSKVNNKDDDPKKFVDVNNKDDDPKEFDKVKSKDCDPEKLVDDVKDDYPKKLNIHLNEILTIPSNSVLITSVSINRKVDNGVNVLLMTNVLKKCVVTPTILTNVHNNCVTLQLANLSDDDVELKVGTKLCEAEYYNNNDVFCDNDVLLQNANNANNTNNANDTNNANNVDNANNKLNDDTNDNDNTNDATTLTPLSLEDIQCDFSPVKERLLDVVNEYRHATWLPDEPLGKYRGDQLKIELKEDVVVNKPPYRIPFAFQKQLDETINSMLKDGIISHSKSSFNSPLIIVQRDQHDIRPCLDYRALNEIIKPISYPLPRISDVLNSIGQSPYMSTVDMASAFHQLQIHPDDRHLTAFTVRNSKFKFNSIPFGLQSSPLFFARVINTVLYDILGPRVFAYIDDIILFNKTVDDHLETIRAVMSKLAEAGLKLKIRKCCFFFANEIKFLGYKKNKNGMSMCSERVKAIKEMPVPTGKRQLQSFLGSVNLFECLFLTFMRAPNVCTDF